MQHSQELPNMSSNYLPCGCHAHTTPPPSTFFNIHLHELLSKANNKQIGELFEWFKPDIYRILLSQFIDRSTSQNKMTYDQQSYYFNTFNHILNTSNASHKASPPTAESEDDGQLSNIDELEQQLEAIEDYKETQHTLPDDVWSRIFQFVDEKTRLLSLPLCSRMLYDISTAPSSWISLQISCSSIYFNFKKSYLFSNFLLKSGRCLTSLVLRDIASMNESHWKHFISFMTYCCPKIINVRIRSSMTQNGIGHGNKHKNNSNHYKSQSHQIFNQLIGSNLHVHQYHHYSHNKQTETVLNCSNAIKSNMFNTLKVFIKHYKKYGGLLIPQNLENIHNISHNQRLQSHRITAIDSSVDDSSFNPLFNILRNHDDNGSDNDNYNEADDDESINILFNGKQMYTNNVTLNPFFYMNTAVNMNTFFAFSHQILKYQRNELQPEIIAANNNMQPNLNRMQSNSNSINVNILEPFCKLSLNQLKTNCVIRPKNLCSFLQKQPYLVVLKASVRYRRDWSDGENEWFWKIPQCLPSNLEIFFLPGHHALPELWVENCLSNLRNLKYFDFFIVNNKYIPSVSINTIYVLAKHCHQIQFVHLHINLDHYISQHTQCENESDDRDSYVVFTKELGNALQLLFANCLKLQRVYCYLPIKFDPSLLLQQIVFVQLPSKRKCKLRIDEYKIGGVKCRRFVFKLMDDVNSLKSKIQ